MKLNKNYLFASMLLRFLSCDLLSSNNIISNKANSLLDQVSSILNTNKSTTAATTSNGNNKSDKATKELMMKKNIVDITTIPNSITKKTENLSVIGDNNNKNLNNLDIQTKKQQIKTTSSDSTNSFNKQMINKLSGTTTKLTGFNKTLNNLKSETGDTYLIEHNSGPITFSENTLSTKSSGSYSGGTMNFQEDEQEKKDENEEEERFNKKEIANQKNAKENLQKSIILAKQIKEDLIQIRNCTHYVNW